MTDEIIKEKCRKFIIDLIFDLVAGGPKKFCMISGNNKFDPDNHFNPYYDMNDMIDKVSNNLFIFLKKCLSSRIGFLHQNLSYYEEQFHTILKQIPLLKYISLYYVARHPIHKKIVDIMLEYKRMIYIDCISSKYPKELAKSITLYII